VIYSYTKPKKQASFVRLSKLTTVVLASVVLVIFSFWEWY